MQRHKKISSFEKNVPTKEKMIHGLQDTHQKFLSSSKPPQICLYTLVLFYHFLLLIHPCLASSLIILSKHPSLKSPMTSVAIQVLLLIEADSKS